MNWESKQSTENKINYPLIPNKNPFKWVVFRCISGVFILVHIGLLGHLIKRESPKQSTPIINLPKGPYSSYKIKAGKNGYEIEYRANDPKV